MINRLVIFLIRKKLRLKKNERFRLANQKKKGTYWFSDTRLIKMIDVGQPVELSTVPHASPLPQEQGKFKKSDIRPTPFFCHKAHNEYSIGESKL